MEVFINTTGCIGQEQNLSTHFFHQTYRKYHILHRISLIIMYPSLHHDNRYSFYFCKYKLALMSGHCRMRKSVYTLIRNNFFHNYMICIISKTGSQDQSQFRHEGKLIFYCLITLIQFFFTLHRLPPSVRRHPILPALHPVPALFLLLFLPGVLRFLLQLLFSALRLLSPLSLSGLPSPLPVPG